MSLSVLAGRTYNSWSSVELSWRCESCMTSNWSRLAFNQWTNATKFSRKSSFVSPVFDVKWSSVFECCWYMGMGHVHTSCPQEGSCDRKPFWRTVFRYQGPCECSGELEFIRWREAHRPNDSNCLVIRPSVQPWLEPCSPRQWISK